MASAPVPQPTRPDPPLKPLSGRLIAAVAAAIALATAALVVALWWAGTSGLSGPELVTARFDALRTGLSVGLGGGGVFALYLAWRRQRSTEIGLRQKERDQADVAKAYALQERVAAATEADAAARRITDLYTKAAEQLGSDKAPVRLAGLYAMERLAQDNPSQRQTIVNVLCAYLRMPFTDDPDDLASAQERQVRVTAQRILSAHLRHQNVPSESFWPDIDLDLSGAVLVEFNMTNTRVRGARFANATFVGAAWFNGVTFAGDARFYDATFTGPARFHNSTFRAKALFQRATFAEPPDFAGVVAPAEFAERLPGSATASHDDDHQRSSSP
ncbi:pentapeptide repeat-containing protein [Actinokineospora fastidiosa]|uniref:Pentapeptide repeat-containing protein n=1 Tax=Actinokineospora fastidiosa TaxID=1816 RepID=A0A918G5T5_9PSEU|nr:pentapeptide repeat-containing protein [Actinokineospora fastidiosa]GGS19067.1 hypothetical protein GCM10010171_09570 [Actinokineospora fastidiosa]